MLLYTLLLSCIAIFFYKESKSMKQMTSRFLPDFNKEGSIAQVASKQLFLISICSAASASIMLFTWVYQQITNTPNLKFFIALSFLIYGGGFILGMYRCYKLKKEHS